MQAIERKMVLSTEELLRSQRGQILHTFINQTVHSLLQLSGKFRYERCVSVQAL